MELSVYRQDFPDTRTREVTPEPGRGGPCLLPFFKRNLELRGPLPGTRKGNRVRQKLVMMLHGPRRTIGLIRRPYRLSTHILLESFDRVLEHAPYPGVSFQELCAAKIQYVAEQHPRCDPQGSCIGVELSH